MMGYKAFDSDWKCLNMQYKVGETFKYENTIQLCERGFHYCTNPVFVNMFYHPKPSNKYAKVKATGKRKWDAIKTVTDELEIIEEIPYSKWWSICNERDTVLDAVSKDGAALHYVDRRWRNDQEIVLAAVSNKGHALQLASTHSKNNEQIVLAAVTQNGQALQHASKELKNNKEIVLAAVLQDCMAIRYASEELKNDKEFALTVVSRWACLISFIGNPLRNDEQFMLTAIKQNPSVYEYIFYLIGF